MPFFCGPKRIFFHFQKVPGLFENGDFATHQSQRLLFSVSAKFQPA